MKLCFVSTTIQQPTGYSKVAYNILQELANVPDLELFHYTSGMVGAVPYRPVIQGITYQENSDHNFEGLQPFCEKHAVDVVMIYNDIGVIVSFLQKWSPPRLWLYLDTVAHGIPAALLKIIDEKAERIYLMNEYWRSVYNFKQARVLEHGVDTNVFKKVDTADIREKLNIPKNAVVFLNANRNSRRKRLDLTISAFVQFSKAHPKADAYLILMTTKLGYYDIGTVLYNEIYKFKHDCSKKVLTIHTDKQLFTDAAINEFYNLADVGLNTSSGEGYGLTVLEHLSVGRPQVITHLPVYDCFVSKHDACFVKPNGEREYYDVEDYSGAYNELYNSADIARAMSDVFKLKQITYSPKSWKSVLEGFVKDLHEYQDKKEGQEFQGAQSVQA